jgi:hypothetical protein
VNVLADVVKQIRVDTAWLPSIVIDDPFATDPTGQTSPLMSLLMPKVTVTTIGDNPVTSEPWGDPGDTKWPMVENVLIVSGLALAAIIIWRMK